MVLRGNSKLVPRLTSGDWGMFLSWGFCSDSGVEMLLLIILKVSSLFGNLALEPLHKVKTEYKSSGEWLDKCCSMFCNSVAFERWSSTMFPQLYDKLDNPCFVSLCKILAVGTQHTKSGEGYWRTVSLGIMYCNSNLSGIIWAMSKIGSICWLVKVKHGNSVKNAPFKEFGSACVGWCPFFRIDYLPSSNWRRWKMM